MARSPLQIVDPGVRSIENLPRILFGPIDRPLACVKYGNPCLAGFVCRACGNLLEFDRLCFMRQHSVWVRKTWWFADARGGMNLRGARPFFFCDPKLPGVETGCQRQKHILANRSDYNKALIIGRLLLYLTVPRCVCSGNPIRASGTPPPRHTGRKRQGTWLT